MGGGRDRDCDRRCDRDCGRDCDRNNVRGRECACDPCRDADRGRDRDRDCDCDRGRDRDRDRDCGCGCMNTPSWTRNSFSGGDTCGCEEK